MTITLNVDVSDFMSSKLWWKRKASAVGTDSPYNLAALALKQIFDV